MNFSGALSGTGSLALTGAGTLILSGSNTYGGSTTVNGGILDAQSTNGLPAGSPLSVGAGGTLILDLNPFYGSVVAGPGQMPFPRRPPISPRCRNRALLFC